MYSNYLASVVEILYPFQPKPLILFNLIFSGDYIIAKRSFRAFLKENNEPINTARQILRKMLSDLYFVLVFY